MTENIATGITDYSVGLFDLDANGRASILTIADCLQEAGMDHGFLLLERGGMAVDPDIGFVLTRLQIRMERYPRWKENIRIMTWLSPVSGNYIIRNFILSDNEGKQLGAAINSAVPFNLEHRKVVPVPDEGRTIMVSDREPPLPHHFNKLNRPEGDLLEGSVVTGFFDCDLYGHVNNVRYIQWGLDVLPHDVVSDSFLAEVDINFRSEADAGSRIIIQAGNAETGNGREYLHSLAREDSGRDLVVMKSRWETQ